MTGLYLLAAHMLGDYILQTDYMAANKLKCWQVRMFHVTTYCMGFIPFLWMLNVGPQAAGYFLAALWVTHFITDSRRWASGDKWPPKPILVDQSIHAVTLAVLAFLFLPGN